MRRRSLASAASVLAVAPLLASTSTIVPQLAYAAESQKRRYGEKVFLKDVYGDAIVFIKKGYDFKKLDDLRFKGDILILKFLFFRHYLVVEGIIFNVYFFKDRYPIPFLKIDKAFFKAPADLRKEEDDKHWPYDEYGRGRPPHHDDDCKLFLDIGRFKVVEIDDKDRYGKSIKVFLLDPDEQELDIKDKDFKEYLCDQAKDDHYYDDAPESEVDLK